ncbi:hypothetical protein K438DRAFT_1751611 [Mycena galopus ATCC 62051]|nr:hypothetical protein K438DRAFT_1751611 [Mycena galopus ATCC 62051]
MVEKAGSNLLTKQNRGVEPLNKQHETGSCIKQRPITKRVIRWCMQAIRGANSGQQTSAGREVAQAGTTQLPEEDASSSLQFHLVKALSFGKAEAEKASSDGMSANQRGQGTPCSSGEVDFIQHHRASEMMLGRDDVGSRACELWKILSMTRVLRTPWLLHGVFEHRALFFEYAIPRAKIRDETQHRLLDRVLVFLYHAPNHVVTKQKGDSCGTSSEESERGAAAAADFRACEPRDERDHQMRAFEH